MISHDGYQLENSETATTTLQAVPFTHDELLQIKPEHYETLDASRLSATAPAVLAQFLERIDVDARRTILRRMDNSEAAEVLAEMHEEYAAEVLEAMREKRAVSILEDFAPDDAADIVAKLSAEDRARLMGQVNCGTAETVNELLTYGPETAGGAMNPSVETLERGMTVEEAIVAVRGWGDEDESMHYIYVLDEQRRLVGSISLKQLIRAKPAQQIAFFMNSDLSAAVLAQTDREKVALKMAECNLPELPVIDKRGVLLGVITHDDVLDIIQAEATEDMQVMAGAGGDEGIHDNIFYSVKKRLPWLELNLCTASIAAGVVICFHNQIGKMPLLAGLMPIVAGIGGNCGQQTLAVTIRSLAIGEIHDSDTREVFFKQLMIGILNGLGVGLVASAVVLLISRDLWLSGVLMAATIANMSLGGLVGVAIPLVMRKLHKDPAQCSSIVLTAITDTCGFLIFLSLGAWLLLQ
jgi:magnesium transporter